MLNWEGFERSLLLLN